MVPCISRQEGPMAISDPLPIDYFHTARWLGFFVPGSGELVWQAARELATVPTGPLEDSGTAAKGNP